MSNVFLSDKDFTNKKILLVDDIVTSGTTLRLLSNYLYNKGASEVNAITLTYKI